MTHFGQEPCRFLKPRYIVDHRLLGLGAVRWRPLNKSLYIVTAILVAKEPAGEGEWSRTRFAILANSSKVMLRCFLSGYLPVSIYPGTFTRVLDWPLSKQDFYRYVWIQVSKGKCDGDLVNLFQGPTDNWLHKRDMCHNSNRSDWMVSVIGR